MKRMALAALLAALSIAALPAPASAMQILDAVDHAELAAEISASGVNRIALTGDRIAKVVRAPDGYAVEHDAGSGDLYLRAVSTPGPAPADGTPVTLFLGTERGFTYRLTLTPAMREPAQILIRNADALPDMAHDGHGTTGTAPASDPHIAALVKLVRAVARRESLAGYTIHTGRERRLAGLALIETWRGPRLAALVFEAGRSVADGSAGLAGTIEETPGMGRVAALWLSAPRLHPHRNSLPRTGSGRGFGRDGLLPLRKNRLSRRGLLPLRGGRAAGLRPPGRHILRDVAQELPGPHGVALGRLAGGRRHRRMPRPYQRAVASNPNRCSGGAVSLSLRVALTPNDRSGAPGLAAGVSRQPTL